MIIIADFITVREMADVLRIGLNKAYKLVKQKDFPAQRVEHKYLVDKSLLNEWLSRRVADEEKANTTDSKIDKK